jgi:hypothetical protein
MVDRRLPSVRDTFIYAKNHFAGHGPATIREMARLLGVNAEACPSDRAWLTALFIGRPASIVGAPHSCRCAGP